MLFYVFLNISNKYIYKTFIAFRFSIISKLQMMTFINTDVQ